MTVINLGIIGCIMNIKINLNKIVALNDTEYKVFFKDECGKNVTVVLQIEDGDIPLIHTKTSTRLLRYPVPSIVLNAVMAFHKAHSVLIEVG
jgi:hypothetical protein